MSGRYNVVYGNQGLWDTLRQPQADVILRTSDGVDFRVHKAILSLATSPVFKDISLPTTAFEKNEVRDGLPVVAVSESSKVPDLALRFMFLLP